MSDLKQLGYGIYLDIDQLQQQSKRAQKSFRDISDTASKGSRTMQDSFAKASSGVGASIGSMVAKFATATAAISMLTKAMKQSLDVNMSFERKASELAAVLGTTKEGVSQLTNAALDLGRRTEFTATQVEELQIALARLGFTNEQILSMQQPVLKFAQAVGADLGAAANFAGASLRAFGMSAEDSTHLLDVLAASTSKSALDFGKLESSMSTIAPVAHAFGLSLEDTVTFLGALANAGFDASTAATAMRNILLNLADANGTLAKGLGHTANTFPDIIASLKECTEKGLDLNATLEMTDKRSVAAFNALISGADDAQTLRDALGSCDGTLEQMSETMTNNLMGATKALQSAWEGFLLTMQVSNGPLADMTNALANGINKLTDRTSDFGKLLLQLIATYGVYKTSLITINALKGAAAMATKGWTKAEIAHYGALKASEKAQNLLNKTIMKNPYALAALAVTALAVGIYKLATASTDAEKAVKKLDKAEKDMTASVVTEQAQIDILFAKLKAAQKGTEEYERAKSDIISKYGNYISKLGDEKTALDDIALAYKTITEEATRAAKARAMESFTREAAEDYGKVIADAREKVYQELKKEFGNARGADGVSLAETYFWRIAPVIEGKGELDAEMKDVIDSLTETVSYASGVAGTTYSYTSNAIQQQLTRAAAAAQTLTDVMAEADRRFGDRHFTDADLIGPPKPTTLGGDTGGTSGGGKTLSDEERKAIAKARKELEQAESEMWMSAADSAVAAMKEGTEKKLAEIENERLQTLAAIDKEQKQLEEAAKKGGTKVGQGTYDLLAQRRADADTAAANARAEVEQERAEYIEGLYRKLGDVFASEEERKIAAIRRTYEEQRKQLEGDLAGGTISAEQYSEFIAKMTDAEKKEITDYWETQFLTNEELLEKERKEWESRLALVPKSYKEAAEKAAQNAISALAKKFKQEELDKIFSDLSEVTIADIDEAISQLENNHIDLNDEDYKELLDYLKGLREQLVSSNNPFVRLAENWKQLSQKMSPENFYAVMSATGQIADNFRQVSDSMRSIAEMTGNEGLATAADVMDDVIGNLQAAQKGAEAWGGWWGAIIGGVTDLIPKVIKWTSGDKKHEKSIAEINERLQATSRIYDEIVRKTEKLYGKAKQASYEEEEKNLQTQLELVEKMKAEEESKKNPDDSAIQAYEDQIIQLRNEIEDTRLAAVDAIFGSDIASAIESMQTALSDAWTSGESSAESVKTQVRKMMQQMVNESVKAYIQARGAMDRIRKTMQDAMADEIITDTERERIESMAESLANEVEAKYGWAKSLFDDSERSGVQGTGIAASQESVDNLDARMTTMQSHTYTLVQGQQELIRISNAILDRVAGIEANTAGAERELGDVRRSISSIKNTMDDITLKGVRIRS